MAKGDTQIRIGKSQAKRVRERPPEAPFGKKLSNKDTLKLSKAAAKNLVQGTIKKNKAAKKKQKGK